MNIKFSINCVLIVFMVVGVSSKLFAGNMGTKVEKIRIIQPGEAERVRRALLAAGATRVIVTRVG